MKRVYRRSGLLILFAINCVFASSHYHLASNCHDGQCQVECEQNGHLCSVKIKLTQNEGFFKVDPSYFYCTVKCDGELLERDGIQFRPNKEGHLGICSIGDGVVTSIKQLNQGFMVARITRESRNMVVDASIQKALCPSHQMDLTCWPGTGGRGKAVMLACD